MSQGGVTNFFFADRSSVISHFRFQKRWGAGYSAGDLGSYTVRIVEADPNTKLPLAGGDVISEVTNYRPGVEATSSGQRFQTAEFTKKGTVEATKPYCFAWYNTHSSPGSNFFAQNNDIQFQFLPDEYPGADWPGEGFFTPARIHVDGTERPWFPYPITFRRGIARWNRCGPPLVEYRYEDGQWSGWGSWGSPYNRNSYLVEFTPTQHIRERFRVTRATRNVKSVWLNLWRLNASPGDLIVTLESGPSKLDVSNGQIIDERVIASNTVYDAGATFQRDETLTDPDLVPWIEVTFSRTITLEIGRIYSLRLRTTNGVFQTTSATRAEQQGLSGKHSDFDTHEKNRTLSWLTFDDSMGLQISTNSGTSWSWHGNRHQMPCLFECI
jgi:hypothetical protein